MGDRAARTVAAFIGIYWTCRVAVDALYFDHRNWLKGKAFVIGHVMLTAVFVSLAATYLSLIGWQLLRG